MNTQTTPTFKPLSYNWEKFMLTNGIAWNHSVKAIAKCTSDGNVELQDGTVLPMAQTRQYAPSRVYHGYVVTMLPQSWLIKEAEYKGHKVLKIEQDYTQPRQKVEFEHGQVVETENLRIEVEGYKTVRKVKYRNDEFSHTVFFPTDLADTTVEWVFRPFEKIEISNYGNEGLYFNYGGGGYGEKYYVTGVSVNEKFVNELGYNLTEGFKSHLLYGKFDEENWTSSPKWLQFLTNPNHWEIEVEYVDYEGYTPKGYVFDKRKLAELNEMIRIHASEFIGQKRVDWRQIAVAAK